LVVVGVVVGVEVGVGVEVVVGVGVEVVVVVVLNNNLGDNEMSKTEQRRIYDKLHKRLYCPKNRY
jgi:hypothetical protein